LRARGTFGGHAVEAKTGVQTNDGAGGPDRESVQEVREHIVDVIKVLHRELLDERYRPGRIRRMGAG